MGPCLSWLPQAGEAILPMDRRIGIKNIDCARVIVKEHPGQVHRGQVIFPRPLPGRGAILAPLKSAAVGSPSPGTYRSHCSAGGSPFVPGFPALGVAWRCELATAAPMMASPSLLRPSSPSHQLGFGLRYADRCIGRASVTLVRRRLNKPWGLQELCLPMQSPIIIPPLLGDYALDRPSLAG